ncbi:MAG: retention module-containing protein, partial [Serpentinimonas sp.]|nr:retention module-containing protein [Serpentinimonas sp.]
MAQIATVTGVVGTVFAIAPDGTVRTLKVGDTLQKGEILRTGANARVELAMADGTVPAAASAAAGNVAIGANAIVKVDENMALGDARPTAQEAAVGIQAIQQVLQALEAGGDLNEELEAAAAGLTGGEGAGSDFVQLSRVQLETGSLSYDYNTVQGEQAELLDTGLEVLPEITLAVVTPPGGGGGGSGLDTSGTWVQIEGTGPGADAGQTITLQLNLSRQSGTAITVDYEWVGGTATAGDDYIVTPRTGTITIPPNTTSVQITVDIARDALVEGDETFSLQLSNPRGGTLGNASVAITLVDDDIEVTASSESLDETGGSEAAGFGSVQGTLAVNYLGSGTPPVVALAADNATWDASTGTLTDNAGGWVVQMAADQTSYTFTQLKALSHPDATNPNDPLDIAITATVTTAVVVAGVTYPSTATDTFIVTVLDDGPAMQASVGVTLDEADLGTVTVAGPGGSVDTGKLVAFGSIAVDSAAGLNKVSGSPMTTGDGNRTREVDATTQTQLVQVKNPTTETIEFEWRDTRTGEVYAKGQVASGEVLYLATTDNSIGQSVQLFVRFEGDTTWTGRSRGTLAGSNAPSATFVVPSDATAVDGSGAGGGGSGADPVVLEGQLNFNAGADGGRITALSAESLTGLTSGGEPVEFTSTTSADGSTITLTGAAGGEGVLTVGVNAATGAYTATLLGPLDHARPNLSGAADPLIL